MKMWMKFLSINTALLIFFFGFLNAKGEASCCDPCNPFNGFFAGVTVGEAINTTHSSYISTIDVDLEGAFGVGVVSLITPFDDHLYNARAYGDFNLGWGKQWCSCLYLGLRASLNFSSHQHDHSNFSIANVGFTSAPIVVTQLNASRIRTKMDGVEPVLDIKPGFVWNRTLFFTLLGVAFNRMKVNVESAIVLSLNDTPIIASNIDSEFHKRQIAFHWGLGLEHFLCDCISLQALYTNTRYREFSGQVVGMDELPGGFEEVNTVTFRSRPNRQTFSAGLAYYF